MHCIENKFSGLHPFVTQFFKCAADTQARRGRFDKKNAHATIRRMDGAIGAGQDSKNTGMDTVRNPQLGTIEHIVLAVPHGSHADSLDVAACIGLGDTQAAALIALCHQWEKALALLPGTVSSNHIGNKYMRIHDASETHPSPRKLFDDLDIGRKVKTQATIGFGNGRTEYAQFFEFFDQVEGVVLLFSGSLAAGITFRSTKGRTSVEINWLSA